MAYSNNNRNTTASSTAEESRTSNSSSVAELLGRPRGQRGEEPRALAADTNAPAKLSPLFVMPHVSWVAACASAMLATFVAAWWCFSNLKRRFAAAKKRVVVIGGGFAGMQIVKDLAFACQVTLLDVRDYFEYTPGVLAAMVGGGPLRQGLGTSGRAAAKRDGNGGGKKSFETRLTVREGAAARIGQLQRPLRSVAPKNADVVRVTSPSAFTVRCGTVDISSGEGSTPDEVIAWDYLVFATGSVYPGPIKPDAGPEMPDATSISRREYFADAAARVGGAAHVLVVGGGVVGVELAAELASASGRAPQRVTLIHKASRLLDNLPSAVGERATRWLKRQGVDVLVGEKFEVQKTNEEEEERRGCTPKKRLTYVGERSGLVVTPDEVIIAAGARPATDFLVRDSRTGETNSHHWEAERAPPPLLDVPLDVGGGIRIDENTLRVDCGIIDEETRKKKLQVFCVGDAASKPPERYLASFAHWEAEYVSHAILRDVDGGGAFTIEKFEAPPRLMCISLGPWDGIFMWGNRVVCTGAAAGLVKLLIELWFKNFLPAPYSVARRLPHMMGDDSSKE